MQTFAFGFLIFPIPHPRYSDLNRIGHFGSQFECYNIIVLISNYAGVFGFCLVEQINLLFDCNFAWFIVAFLRFLLKSYLRDINLLTDKW